MDRLSHRGLFVAPLLFAGMSSLWAQLPKNAPYQRVLLISIDGMHALDFANCSTGNVTCPSLASLATSGVTYLQAHASRPSDSFPGLTALVSGASPRTSGVFYDDSYDRSLIAPESTGAKCPGTPGTEVAYFENLDKDVTKLDGGGGIDPKQLPRDPTTCAPVFPHSFIRVNTMFEVIRANGGYTAWSDKHPAYDLVNGPSGKGVDDLYTPEINSNVVPLSNVPGCSPLPDTVAGGAWTDNFKNIQCYDQVKVQAVLNWIDGKKSDGSAGPQTPNIFGMNFQAVSVGQKLNEAAIGVQGGYLDAAGTPSDALADEIQFVDAQIGRMVSELQSRNLFSSTLIIISAKHGQSPINIKSLVRIPADDKTKLAPSDLLGDLVALAAGDDASVLWLKDQSQTATAIR